MRRSPMQPADDPVLLRGLLPRRVVAVVARDVLLDAVGPLAPGGRRAPAGGRRRPRRPPGSRRRRSAPPARRGWGSRCPRAPRAGARPAWSSTSSPRRPPGTRTRRSSASIRTRSAVTHRTPSDHAASTLAVAIGRSSDAAAATGKPNRRRADCAACTIGSVSTGRPDQRPSRCSDSHAAGPPSPAPESRKRWSPCRSSPPAIHARSAGEPLPRQPAGIAWSSPSARTASSVQAATVSNSASIAESRADPRASSVLTSAAPRAGRRSRP